MWRMFSTVGDGVDTCRSNQTSLAKVCSLTTERRGHLNEPSGPLSAEDILVSQVDH